MKFQEETEGEYGLEKREQRFFRVDFDHKELVGLFRRLKN